MAVNDLYKAENELYEIVKLGDAEYNINAVHARAASKVDNILTVHQVLAEDNVQDVVFDGEADKEVSVVPATGGTFTGPVNVQTIEPVQNAETLETPEGGAPSVLDQYNTQAINLGDVRKLISLLTGHPLYHYDGTSLQEEVSPVDPMTLQNIKLITGSFADYAKFIEENPAASFFLYICDDTGQIFFGLGNAQHKQLGTNTLKLVYESDPMTGFTAEDFKDLQDQADSNEAKINSINDQSTGVLTQAKTYTNEEVKKLQDDIEDGTVTAAKATSATSAASADKATKLATARTIKTNLGSTTAASFDGTGNVTPGVSGTLPVANGGTGKTTNTANAVLVGNGTSSIKNISSAKGAFYSTAADAQPTFGTLPESLGGTGQTDLDKVKVGSAASADNATLAAKATVLETSRTITTNLESTTGASFNGSAAIRPGVAGKLPIGNGGTGGTTGKAATKNLFNDINESTSDVSGTTKVVFKYATPSDSDGVFYYRDASYLLDYIKDNHGHPAGDITSGKLAVARGGTGEDDLSKVTVGKATSATSATKATQDSTGWTISAGYYRVDLNKTDINTIYIKDSAPKSTDGKNGDIWIEY